MTTPSISKADQATPQPATAQAGTAQAGNGTLLKRLMPKSLFGRSLIIVVAPMVLLQSVIAFVFLERHWALVTQRMSEAVARDIGAIVAVLESYEQDTDFAILSRIASNELSLRVDVLPSAPLPPPAPKPFFTLLDRTFALELSKAVGKPFWVDTVGNSNLIEVRIKLDDANLRIFARRSQAYATNSHIFLVWMVGASLVLLLIAILFLRNQIRPIQRLAKAASRFGRGQSIADIPHTGAREVRAASHALVEMSQRIERQIDQRTIMLAGVSHDLRTVLTRFRLQLAMMPEGEDKQALSQDVSDMEHMLSDYLDFASGSAKEAVATLDVTKELDRIAQQMARLNVPFTYTHEGNSHIDVRPNALHRCLQNLIGNAARYGKTVTAASQVTSSYFSLTIDDDGPGVPAGMREEVFKPFFRLDKARNQDKSGSGLGLAIARDIVLTHGGEIYLDDSPMGGLRVVLTLPISPDLKKTSKPST